MGPLRHPLINEPGRIKELLIKNCDGGELIIDIYTLIESKLNLYTALFTTQVLKCFTARTEVTEGDRRAGEDTI